MAFILNLLVAVLIFGLAEYVLGALGLTDPLRVVIAIILGIVAFVSGVGASLLT